MEKLFLFVNFFAVKGKTNSHLKAYDRHITKWLINFCRKNCSSCNYCSSSSRCCEMSVFEHTFETKRKETLFRFLKNPKTLVKKSLVFKHKKSSVSSFFTSQKRL